MPSSSVRSQAHTDSQPWPAMWDSSRRRVGSDSALRSTERRSASAASRGPPEREQHSDPPAATSRGESSSDAGLAVMTRLYIDGHQYVGVLFASISIDPRSSGAREHSDGGRGGATRTSHAADVLRGPMAGDMDRAGRSEEHTSELQSRGHLVCRL